MSDALFLNGVFEDILNDIVNAQAGEPELICYLQPYSTRKIIELEKAPPTPKSPKTVYFSTTATFNDISYAGLIVGWENKQKMSAARKAAVTAVIKKHQPCEVEGLYMKANGKDCINLLAIKQLKRMPSSVPITFLVKDNGVALKKRTQPGKWSYVKVLPSWVGTGETLIKENVDHDLDEDVKRSLSDGRSTRLERLASAPPLPQKVQVLSQSFRRNADVIVEVMLRANGKCEACKKDAPFFRASDGSPFLEIHHTVSLSEGGTDTVGNAQAICPNCHRKMHFGCKGE